MLDFINVKGSILGGNVEILVSGNNIIFNALGSNGRMNMSSMQFSDLIKEDAITEDNKPHLWSPMPHCNFNFNEKFEIEFEGDDAHGRFSYTLGFHHDCINNRIYMILVCNDEFMSNKQYKEFNLENYLDIREDLV